MKSDFPKSIGFLHKVANKQAFLVHKNFIISVRNDEMPNSMSMAAVQAACVQKQCNKQLV